MELYDLAVLQGCVFGALRSVGWLSSGRVMPLLGQGFYLACCGSVAFLATFEASSWAQWCCLGLGGISLSFRWGQLPDLTRLVLVPCLVDFSLLRKDVPAMGAITLILNPTGNASMVEVVIQPILETAHKDVCLLASPCGKLGLEIPQSTWILGGDLASWS